MTFTLVAVVAVLAFLAYAVYASMKAGQARSREIEVLAPHLGLTWAGDFAAPGTATGNPQDAFEALRRTFGDFRRFQGSMQPKVSNWMRGEAQGAQICLFDYHEPASGRSIADTQTLAWIAHPSVDVPSFSLVPIPGRYVVPVTRLTQTAASHIGNARFADVEVAMPTHPDFDAQYLLRGPDESAVRRVFTDRIVRFLTDNPGWMIEGDGARLLMARLSADEVRTFWRGAVPPSDAQEIVAAAKALQQGTLGEQLTKQPGVPPNEMRTFLNAAMQVSAAFRTS